MSIVYAYDLYPRADPRDGARLVRFSNLQSAAYRDEANGTGAGEFSIRATDAEAAFIDPRGLQYVRVVEIDTSVVDGGTDSGFAEKVVGGIFLENGNFEALTDKSTKLLTFGGAGTLSYLGRAQMWSRAYFFTTDDLIIDGTWHLYSQPSISGGDYLGAVLHRVLAEAASFAAVPDGIVDRSESAVPDMIVDFGLFNDSASNLWTIPSGEFKVQVGDNVLSITRRLMEAGLYVEMDPDTFEVHCWERGAPASRGQDKTGGAWGGAGAGAGVIRFQSPTDATVPTGNILSEAKRGLGSYVRRSIILSGDAGTYVAETGTADIPWEGFYPSDVLDTDTLTSIATEQLTVRGDAGDTLRLRFKLGKDAATGLYRPFGDKDDPTNVSPIVQVNDRVRVHTGTGQWDYNEDDFPVAALTVSLRPGGDWDAWADIGASYTSMAERAFQARAVATHSHPPNPPLCLGVACAELVAADLIAQISSNGDAEDTAGGHWSGGAGYQTTWKHAGARSYGDDATTSITVVYTFAPLHTFFAGVRYVLDVWGHQGGDSVTSALKFGKAGVDEITEWSELETEVVGGDPWTRHRLCWVPTADRIGVRFQWAETQTVAGGNSEFVLDDLVLYTSIHVGTDKAAARCNHTHPPQLIPAANVAYDDTASGLDADDVQEAIDELASGGTLTVEELDAAPSVSPVNTIRFPDGSVTDDGGGQVTIDLADSVHGHGDPSGGFRGARVIRTTDLTTGANNNTIAFDTETYDTDGLWVVGTPSRFTIPAEWDGLMVQMQGNAIWLATGTHEYAELKIFRNGDTANPIAVSQDQWNDYNPAPGPVVSWPVQVATGDYFELCARTAEAATALAADDYSLSFAIWLVQAGPAGADGADGSGVGELLIADDHSSPLVFADILQNDDGDNFLYADA